jgi:hypothetical protein
MQSPAAHAGTGIGVVRLVQVVNHASQARSCSFLGPCRLWIRRPPHVRHPIWSAVAGGGVAEARCRTQLIVPVNDMVVPYIFGLLSYCPGTVVLNGVRCH